MSTHPFRFCLNTSTIAGQRLGVTDQIALAGRCGYDGIEVWMRSLHDHVEVGGTLAEVASAAATAGVVIENVIGFVPWAVDDTSQREAGLAEAAKDLAMLQQIGCRRLAAPPFGVTEVAVDVDDLATRFDVLTELAAPFEVTPQLELWGFSATLGHLSELLQVAEGVTSQPTKLLLDAYHLHRGRSAYQHLALIDGTSLDVFHLNDFPIELPREQLTDADRVYPGDGTGSVSEIIQLLATNDTPIALSIELFNRELWELPAEQVATTGLDKMRNAVDLALT